MPSFSDIVNMINIIKRWQKNASKPQRPKKTKKKKINGSNRHPGSSMSGGWSVTSRLSERTSRHKVTSPEQQVTNGNCTPYPTTRWQLTKSSGKSSAGPGDPRMALGTPGLSERVRAETELSVRDLTIYNDIDLNDQSRHQSSNDTKNDKGVTFRRRTSVYFF